MLAAILIASFGLFSSCGGGDRFELTLRARDTNGTSFVSGYCNPVGETPDKPVSSSIDRCTDTFEERRWLTADGRRAITPAHTEVTFYFYAFADVVCGGQDLGPMNRWESGPGLPADEDSFELKIDDGNTLMLDQQTGLWGEFTGTECFEMAGRWRGTAGQLRDHTGSFTILYDSIQTVIRLVED